MNEDNLNYLTENLKYLGFGEGISKDLEKQITQQPAEFKLLTQVQHLSGKISYEIHFRKSSQSDMYFLNKYDAKLMTFDPAKEKEQTFYINKGHGVTAKEAFNLLEGRSVYKELVNKENEPYKAWIKLDFDLPKDKNDNHKIKQFSEGFGYDLEKTLSRFNVKELNDPDLKAAVVKSLQKGNIQQVTVVDDRGANKYNLEANPNYKTINVYDAQQKAVRRETILKPEEKDRKKEQKAEMVQEQKQAKSRSKKH
jgi:hypothetical protein